MNMGNQSFGPKRLILISALALAGCNNSLNLPTDAASESADHQELQIVDPAAYGSNQSAGTVTSMSARGVSARAAGTISAQALVSIGSVYLENQLPPLTVGGTVLQATDVSASGTHAFVTYSSVDTGGTIIKKGAVQHVTTSSCDNTLTPRVEYCANANASLQFPTTDLFAAYTDGTGLWVAGSTSAEDQAPNYGRLYKVTLNGSLDPTAVAVTQTLASFAGTGITKVGTNLLVTYGTSTTAAQQGGLGVLDATTLVQSTERKYYDARAVAIDPTNTARAFVVRGAIDSSNKGAVAEFAVTGTSAAVREIATGGNSIAESKSSVLVGQQLILTSMGDQGFRVSCKATGASLVSIAAPILSGVPTALTVTNSVAALPGYILAANGEAGVYLYQFQKTYPLNSNLCAGVTLTLVGRLSLAGSATYVNGELSANSVKYLPTFNLLGVLTSKLVVIASGNKGVSLLNMGGLTVSLGQDIDDF